MPENNNNNNNKINNIYIGNVKQILYTNLGKLNMYEQNTIDTESLKQF